ncbi:uncharacterized protein TNCV_2458491 [Trichonephila clavipes]|nr:uncharacterized protein TNCV_2458491 [Trichonephila clavipes]
MTAQRYVHDILQPHMLPLIQRLPEAIFQQDNARPHTARVSKDCLSTVTTLSWPVLSPDLSPIEHICDHFGWRVGHPMIVNSISPNGFEKPVSLTFSTLFTTSPGTTAFVDISGNIKGKITEGSRIKGASKKEIVDEIPSPIYKPPTQAKTTESPMEESNAKSSAEISSPVYIFAHHTTSSELYEDVLSTELSSEIHSILHIPTNQSKLSESSTEESNTELSIETLSPVNLSLDQTKTNGTSIEESSSLLPTVPQRSPTTSVPYSQENSTSDAFSTAVPSHELTQEDKLEFGGDAENVSSDEYSTPISERIPTLSVKASSSDITTPHTELTTITSEITSMLDVKTTLNSHSDDISSDVSTHQYEFSTATPAKDPILDAEATLSSLSSDISTDVTTPQFDLSSPTEIKFKETGSSKTNHTKTNYGVDESSFDIVPSTSPSTTVSQEANAENYSTQRSPGPLYDETTPYTESSSETPKEKESTTEKVSHTPPNFVRIKGQKPTVQTTTEVSVKMSSTESSTAHELTLNETSFDDTKVTEETGVKNAEEKDPYQHTKGQRPQIKQKPLLPVGVIPGESKLSGNLPISSTKRRPILVSVPGEGSEVTKSIETIEVTVVDESTITPSKDINVPKDTDTSTVTSNTTDGTTVTDNSFKVYTTTSTAFETTTVGVTKPSDIDETFHGVTTTETIDSKEYATAATFETTTVGVTKPSDIDETSHGVTTTETIDSKEYATAASTTQAPFSIYVTQLGLTTTDYETSTSSGKTQFPTEEKTPDSIHNKESSTQISHSSTAFETTTVGVTKPSDIDETSSGVTTTETIDSKEYSTAASTTQAPFSIYVTQLGLTTTEYETSTSSGITEFPTEEKSPDNIHNNESSTQISHSSTAFETTTVGVTKPSDIDETSHGVTTTETIDSNEYATAASTTEAPFSIYVTELDLTTTEYETSTSSGITEFPTEEKNPGPIHNKESSTQISHSSTAFETTTVGVTKPSDIDETSSGVTTTETIDSKEYATAANTTQAPFSIYVTQLAQTTTEYDTSTSSGNTEFPTEEKNPDPIHKKESSTQISHSSTAFETTTVGVTKPSDIDETAHGVTTTETIDSKEYATAASTTQAPFSIYVTQLGLTTSDYDTHSSTAFETTTVGVTKPSDIEETSHGVTTTETIDSKEYATAASTTQVPISIYVTQLGLTTTAYETSTSSGKTEFTTEEKIPDPIHKNESSTEISHSSTAFETTTVGVTKPSDIDETSPGVTTTETIDSKEYATAASTTQAPFNINVTQLGLTTTDYETSTSSGKTEFPTEEKIPDPIHKKESSTQISHSSTAFETTTVGVTKPSDIDETSDGVTTTETIDSKEYAIAANTTQAPFSIYVTQLGLTTTDYETSTSSVKTEFPTEEKIPDPIHKNESSTEISHSSTAFETTTVGVTKPSDIDETSHGVTTTETIDSKEYATAASTTQAPFSIYVTHSSTTFETTTVGVTRPSDIDETSYGVTSGTEISYTTLEENHPSTLSSVTSVIPDNDASQFFTTEAPIKISISDPSETDLTEENFSDNDGASTLTTTEADQLLFNSLTTIDVNEETSTTFDDLEVKKLTDTSTIAEVTSSLPLTTERLTEGLTTHVSFDGEEIKSPPVSEQTTVSGETSKETSTNLIGMTTDKSITEEVSSEAGINETNYTVHTNVETGSDHGNDTLIDKETHDESSFTSTKAPLTFSLTTEQAEEFKTHKTMTIPSRESTFTSSFGETTVKASTDFHSATSLPDEFSFQTTLQEVSSTQSSKVDSGSTTKYQPDVVKTTVVEGQDVKETSLSTDAEEYFTENKSSGSVTQTTLISKVPTTVLEIETSSKQPATEYPSTFESATDTSVGHEKINYPDENETSLDVNETSHHLEKNTSFIQGSKHQGPENVISTTGSTFITTVDNSVQVSEEKNASTIGYDTTEISFVDQKSFTTASVLEKVTTATPTIISQDSISSSVSEEFKHDGALPVSEESVLEHSDDEEGTIEAFTYPPKQTEKPESHIKFEEPHKIPTEEGIEVTRSTIRADVGVAIVPQTISRHLAEANLKSKRPFRAFPLTPEHRQLILQSCRATLMWNVTDWQKVLFSDESRFVLRTDDNRVRVWRHPGPFLNGLPRAIFQQDNARPHTARVAQDFLRHFQTIPWPAR